MKCQICSKKTNWDKSVGVEEFIVCNSCVEKLKKYSRDGYQTLNFIFACGYVRQDNKNTNKK